jgi:limonene 1,2-monooxygenase
MRDAYTSEHYGEPVYINRVDTLPVPELLMCKAAALTKRIRMGAAVTVIHLWHPVDTAIRTAVTDNVIGGNRFFFGFGSGFPSPLFSEERGLSYDDRHERLREPPELIEECWTTNEPFDWHGKHWQAKNIVATPKPMSRPMPMATATETDATIEMAARRGWTLISAHEMPAILKAKTDKYLKAALAAGHKTPLEKVTNARFVYLANLKKEAMADMREAVAYEMEFQRRRGLLRVLLRLFDLPYSPDTVTFDELVEAGVYNVGEPDEIAERLRELYDQSGGFGTLLIVTGKGWATREKRLRSMRMFMEHVAPKLRDLAATRVTL